MRLFSTTDPFLEKQRSEKVLIVDEHNNPVRVAPRFEMRRDSLWHRASFVFVITDKKHGEKLLVQKRTMKKDQCPGYFALAHGGVVGEGEESDVNA